MRIRHLVIRFVLPLIWRWSPERKIRALEEFAATEKDSAWQSLYALRRIHDTKTRRFLFFHVLEELFHSHLFYEFAKAQSHKWPAADREAREAVFREDLPLDHASQEFMDFIHRGEKEIHLDLKVYQEALKNTHEFSIFSYIEQDEEGHAVGSRPDARPKYRRSFQLNFRRVRRSLLKIGHFFSGVVGTLVYFGAAIIMKGECKRRLRLSFREQFEIFRAEVDEFNDQARRIK